MSENSEQPCWSIEKDLDGILSQTAVIWEELRGSRFFITGGTGFIGTWLLESLRHADEALRLGIHAVVLSRNASAFQRKAPHLAQYAGFEFFEGDVIDCPAPGGAISHVIHAAAETTNRNTADRRATFETLVTGTRRVLDIAAEKKAARTLFLSSGAVYGRQSPEVDKVDEQWTGAPRCNDPASDYAEGKRSAETLCAIYGEQFGVDVVTARIFALLGPYIPLDAHFAAGNFIRDAIQGKPVNVQGDGKAVRSYLYAADLIVWLLHLLVRGRPGKAYNVGSDQAISIADLARLISQLVGIGKVEVLGKPDAGWNAGRYVPSTDLAARELGLRQTVFLPEQIRKTALWARTINK